MSEGKQFCDECMGFVAWPKPLESAPGDYNPCRHGHRMSFDYPKTPTDLNWGFTRSGCGDWMPCQRSEQAPLVPNAPARTPDWHLPTQGTLTHDR